jgi:hypothetical protein
VGGYFRAVGNQVCWPTVSDKEPHGEVAKLGTFCGAGSTGEARVEELREDMQTLQSLQLL